MKKITFLISFQLFTLLFFAQKKTINPGEKGSFETKEIYSVKIDDETVKEGPYELWYDGVKLITGQYQNNKKEGLWKYQTIEGDLFYQGFFSDNKKNGSWKYFLNKRPLCFIHYKNDLPDSTWKSFFENGSINVLKTYSEGKLNGQYREYEENGKIKSDCSFLNNNIEGTSTHFFSNGNISTKIDYKNNYPYNVIEMKDSLGINLNYGTLKNDNGTLIRYYLNGKIAYTAHYLKGMPNDTLIDYFKDGSIQEQAIYKDGKLNGSYIFYRWSGQPKEKGQYLNGQRIGEWKFWDEKGNIHRTKLYKENDSLNTTNYAIREHNPEDVVYTVTEKMPEFQGGIKKLLHFLGSNIHYPQASKEAGISGKVYVKFVIDEIGKLKDLEILRGVNEELNEEAANVILRMPSWRPAFQNNFPVKVVFSLPVNFQLK